MNGKMYFTPQGLPAIFTAVMLRQIMVCLTLSAWQQELHMHLERLRAAADVPSGPSSRAATPALLPGSRRRKNRRGMNVQIEGGLDDREQGAKSSSRVATRSGRGSRKKDDRSKGLRTSSSGTLSIWRL